MMVFIVQRARHLSKAMRQMIEKQFKMRKKNNWIFLSTNQLTFFVFLHGHFVMNYERAFRTIYQQVDGAGPLQSIRTGKGIRRFPPDVEQHCT